MTPRISLLLLTRNEEPNLERAIGSCSGCVDEVLVADTGSTDGTVARAVALGARVVEVAWDDDFGAGRNAALAAATSDWVLWLNPDEALAPESREQVRILAERGEAAGVAGYLARIRHVWRAERPDQFSETLDARLFRRELGRYQGRIHPVLTPAKAGAVLEPSDLVLTRLAYLSQPTEAKLRWGLRLVERELADRPESWHAQVERARTLLLLGDPAAVEAMEGLAARLEPYRESPTAPHGDVQLVLDHVLATDPSKRLPGAGAWLDRPEAATLAVRWFPNCPALMWRLAEGYFRMGQLRAAAVLLERLARLGIAGGIDPTHGFDPRTVGIWAWLNLSRCYVALGEKERARPWLELALRDPESRAEAQAIEAGA